MPNKALPAVLVGGPPHAGKSVLFYRLTQALRALNVPHHAIRACPDGEGNWFHEGQPEMVSEIRIKLGVWPTSFVEHMCQDLEYRCLPFLVDMGGRPKDSQLCLLQLCTHAILLHRSDWPDDIQRWQQIVDQHNLVSLAQLYSAQTGNSTITALSPIVQGTICGLERHMPPPEDDPLFDKLVERVATLFRSYDLADQKKVYFERSPTELALDMEDALQTFTTTSSDWQPAMLQPYLESIPADRPLTVYGVGPNWLYAALAAHAERQPFYLFDPKLPFGWVRPVPVVIDGEQSRELCIEIGCTEELTVIKIIFPFDRIEYFQSTALAFPGVAPKKGLIIDGRVPYWLLTALVRLYKEVGVPWIAPFYPRFNQAVVAYSCVEMYRPGDLLAKPLLELQYYR